MLAPLGQAIDALESVLSGFLTSTPGPAPDPDVVVLTNTPRLAGIGGFVGLNASPRAELHARRLDAEIAVRVFGNNRSNLADAESQAARDLLAADPVLLRQAGVFRLRRIADRDTPVLRAADGIGASFGRDLLFAVSFEHRPLPTQAEGQLGEVPADITTAALTRSGGLIYSSEFEDDPLGDFNALDRDGGSGTNGNWTYDAGAQEVIQTGTTSGGNNGIAANKTGTYLVLDPSSGGAVENFIVTAEMQCGATGTIGFVFRFTDIENFGFAVLESPADIRLMGKRIAGSGALLESGGQDDTQGFPPDTWFRLRLLVDADRFEMALNETTVLTGRDSELTGSGTVGFFCRRADTARFRHFRLSSL
ncbi:family 16 glycoside hydrolase [Sulfitobacter sp. D35]|uniref:family 16 glycoside hydrolase n=1 Tax=Sulfitobacter sp. D35 TaxID=3083252 RepID=UPI0029700813|nr:family 16 glycoside hydrolase [Sulfitobacter sp. D35]MDW4498758.1 family 16 glycoside hydrolase [Sulfitobacter sp. D35]